MRYYEKYNTKTVLFGWFIILATILFVTALVLMFLHGSGADNPPVQNTTKYPMFNPPEGTP